eukprot:CAMPEP_0182469386 /NCGR_PEP_ID=MMETSP1319-20130603/17006_1 /TAXON_ID=172717 /ORGANISM="Bolidomonas pacifica, Strain RCC208" /LENGTH=378 /DNA_ID=CAMNT_0024669689 /DNA_START=1 /DNA_END=1134 /DNA_ORIENTATION=+
MQQLHHRLLHRASSSRSCIISSFSFFSVPKGSRGHVGSLRLLSTSSSSSSSSSFSTSIKPAPSATPLDPAVQSTVLTACADLHSSILPLNDRLRGPLGASSAAAGKGSDSTSLPFVLLVGNHSSGKSSFINHVLGRPVQTAGVAPTDDSFTVIAPGPSDVDTDGPALVGDPTLGFDGLRHFGPSLIHHTRLKVRADTNCQSFMLVDSPGMIDSPHAREGGGGRVMDRGYDFEGVVKWFAERADVILLFFDPDKPGTTGETLSTLVNSLAGLDHKLHIILNKADQFSRIHDFARAYGSLCWNLSKVIGRKDLPVIWTMCLPRGEHKGTVGAMETGMEDLHRAREEVISEVMKAPARRVDNAITRLGDGVGLLSVHARVQ